MTRYESYLKYFLAQKTRADLQIDAGKDLSKKVIELFTNHDSREDAYVAVEWFYSPMNLLKGHSLADLCQNEMIWLAERIVDRIYANVNNPQKKEDNKNMKTLDDLAKDAGNDLTRLITGLIKEDAAIDWFYNCKVPILDNKTPSEYVQEKGQKPLYSKLMTLVQGNIGP